MPTLRPTIAIANSLKSSDVSQSVPQERLIEAPLATPAVPSDMEIKSFAIVFVGMLLATIVGFVSEIRPIKPDSLDHGYDESLGTQVSSSSGAFLSKCSDDGERAVGVSKDSSDGLGLSAAALGDRMSPKRFAAGESEER